MIGLRLHARDAALTARCGDWGVPSENEMLALIANELLADSLARPVSAEWTYARWKPRIALTLGYDVAFADGRRETVVAKFHRGEKFGAPNSYDVGARLVPCARLAGRGLTLTSFPYDRELPGLERAFDMRRLARHVNERELFAALKMRAGSSRCTVLRYKPERRAVLKLDLSLRESRDLARESRRLILRVHPPALASSNATTRRRFEASAIVGLTPRLFGVEERTGVLLEEFLEVHPFAPNHFGHALIAGELLARLHATTCDAQCWSAPRESFEEWTEFVPEIARASSLFTTNTPRRSTWIHGDFHPDQVALASDGSGGRLLDLDALRIGDPCADLANWIADQVTAQRIDWRDAAHPLLESYVARGGIEPDVRELAAHVARALVRSAVGALRRLEEDAVQLARERLAIALEIASDRAAAGSSATIERIEFAKDGARIVTECNGKMRRWFAERDGERFECSPRCDVELPLSAEIPALEHRARVEVLAYRPGRRVVLRCDGGADGRTIVKGYRRGRDHAAAERLKLAGRAARGLSTRVGELLEHDSRACAVVALDLGGTALDFGTLALARFADFGADLRCFQSRADLLEAGEFDVGVHTQSDELAVIELLRARLADAGVEPPRNFDATFLSLAHAARRVPSHADALAHRDLHDGQLLDLGTGLGWIDFDLLTRADSALDAGNLLAHIELRRRQGVVGLDRARAAELRAAFLRGFGRSDHADFERRLAFYESATLLRLALVHATRPPWTFLCSELIASAALIARSLTT